MVGALKGLSDSAGSAGNLIVTGLWWASSTFRRNFLIDLDFESARASVCVFEGMCMAVPATGCLFRFRIGTVAGRSLASI